jgi:hypothetical protein
MNLINTCCIHILRSTAIGSSYAAVDSASEIVKIFFKNVFTYPDQHFIVVALFCAVIIGIAVGTVFLVKKAYERYCVQN